MHFILGRTFGFCAALIFLTLSSTSAQAAGFAGGNVFEYTSAVGDVLVHCPRSGGGGGGPGGGPRGPSSASFRCYGYVFSPAEYAQFVGPKVNGNRVELTATREDGSTRTKTSDYDGSLGASTDTFNLWINTVFQRPLLKLGRNDVAWTVTRDGRTVQSGNFIADVYEKPELRCPMGSITSWDPNGCSNSGSACGDYFQQYGRDCR